MNPPEMCTGKILTFDSPIFTRFFVKFYTRTHLDELVGKFHGNKKKKQKKKPDVRLRCRARAQQGGGRWGMLLQCAYSV